MPPFRLFISCVSKEFGHDRAKLARDLNLDAIQVIHEEMFTATGKPLLESLEESIRSCDGIMQLVGKESGATPTDAEVRSVARRLKKKKLPQGLSWLAAEIARVPHRLTYTQWEAYLAEYHGRKRWFFITEEVEAWRADAALDSATLESQRDHLNRIRSSGELRCCFSDFETLRIKMLRNMVDVFGRTAVDRDSLAEVVPVLPYGAMGELFIGREDFLDKIWSEYQSASGQGHWPKHVIRGMGGIGKTRVAVEYAWRHRKDYNALLFVDASSPEALRASQVKLAEELCKSSTNDERTRKNVVPTDDATRIKELRDWMLAHPGWLLIVDNVDDQKACAMISQEFSHWSTGHVLITGRWSQWGADVKPFELGVLDPRSASLFLFKRTEGARSSQADDSEQARSLTDELGYLCLALEQAGAYIADQEITFAEYRSRWAKNERNIRATATQAMNYYGKSKGDPDTIAMRSIATTWLTAFDELTPAAKSLLSVLSWFAPEPLPNFLIESLNEPDVDSAVAELRRYSLLQRSEHAPFENKGRMHRLVQEVTRDRMGVKERKKTLSKALEAVDSCVTDNPCETKSWPKLWDPLRQHIYTLAGHVPEKDDTELTSRLWNQLGLYFRTKSLFAEAELLFRRSLTFVERYKGAEHPIVSVLLLNVVSVCEHTNRFAEAEDLARRALAIDEAAYGSNHPNTASSLNSIATILRDTNRLPEAEPYYRRIVGILERSPNKGEPDIALVLSDLAWLLHNTSRTDEAEKLFRRVLSITEKYFDPDHVRVAAGLNNLALLLSQTQRDREAEPLFRRALKIQQESYGEFHPDTSNTMNNIAKLLANSKQYPEAERLFRRCLEIDESFFGPDNPVVSNRLSNLAFVLQHTKRMPEAESLFRRALTIKEKSYEPDHPEIAIDLNNLAMVLIEQRRSIEAEPLLHRHLAIFAAFTHRTGRPHPHLMQAIISYLQLAQMLRYSDQTTREKLEHARVERAWVEAIFRLGRN